MKIIGFLMFIVPFFANAVGVEYVGSKPFDCDNPTTLENGDPITPIDRVEIYVGDTPDFTVADSLQTILMPGGCARIQKVNITPVGIGQKYQRGIAYLENGGESALSSELPFTVILSPPNPPVMTE